MARKKTALRTSKTRAKSDNSRRRANAREETERLRPGLSFPVVAIGASAGGLAAFSELLKALPPNTGMAFVLIQHLEPKHESALTALLSKATSMPVAEVSEGMAVEPNCVYVIPPNKDMTIRKGVLRLAPRSAASGPQRPIDDFSIALAEEQGDAAIGVVLSGTGSDGTYGLKAIKAAGGVTFAQDPKTAQWSAMPMSAIAAGSVDFVLSPKRIAAELARIGRHPYLADARDMPEGSDLDKLCLILRSEVGIDFRLYKQATVRRRIARRMALQKIATLKKYAQILKQNAEEAHALADDIFIHVTSFFRDPECFQALRKQVLAKLGLKRPAEDPIRIWVAGCSTGEEVYSIAMLLLEELGERANRIKIQIFGTDVQESAVEHARAAIYSEAAVARLTPVRLKRFFVQSDHGYRVQKSIRDLCVFARHDIAKDPPFSKLDLISCRNVLIYMGPALQKRILSVFQFALKPGGFLFLGNSESVSDYSDAFAVEDQKHRIFLRKLTAAAFREFPSTPVPRGVNVPAPRTSAAGLVRDFRKEAEGLLLEEYAPPALVVDPDLHIVHFQGDVSPYLAPATGQPSFHLLKMVRPEFVLDLRTAISKARKEGVAVRNEGVQFKHEGKPAAVRLEVQPLSKRNGKNKDLLVVFRSVEPAGSALSKEEGRKSGRAAGKKRAPEIAAKLARELASTREHLRALIAEHETAQEEMKAANEEILSSNEELQSANEELETAKEELQSANEELVTLNDELQNRNDELNVLMHDLSNLLVGVNIPVLVLDADLHVRRFTPVAGALLNLIPGDVGRPFSDIASTLDVADWQALFRKVTDRGEVVDREVSDQNGHRYSMRVCPYRVGNHEIEGVLVVMLDVDLIYRARDEAQKSGDYARAIIETIHDALVVLDSEYRVLTVNRSFCDLFRVSLQDVERQSFFGTSAGQWSGPRLRDLLGDVLAKSTEVKDLEHDHDFPEIGRRTLLLRARRIRTSGMILIAIEDVTERKQAQKELQRSEAAISALLDSTPQSVLGVNVNGKIVLVNGNTERMFGYRREELLGQPLDILIPEKFREHHAELHQTYFANVYRRPMGIGLDLEGRRKDGTYFPVEIALSVIDTAAGKIAVAFVNDITNRKRVEDALRQREHEINTVLDDNPDVILRLNREFRYTYVNAKTAKVAGIPREAFVGKTPGEVGLPQDLIDQWRRYTVRTFETGQPSILRFSYPSPGGATEWEEQFIPEFAPDGSVESVLCIGRDVTERNRLQKITETANEHIRALAASLLTAQEEERRRVSGLLHDKICQQLAALAIDMGGLAAESPAKVVQERLKTLQARVVTASEATRHIAYELHPSVLDDLGLEASLKDLCNQFSAQHPDIALEFTGAAATASIPREVASCLYRVARECLQNIAQHANAKHASIALASQSGVLGLTITDDGVGFDPETVKGHGGLGLIFMEERARLVRGKLSITARQPHGTRIALDVPVQSDNQ
jgi:two-component system CheB/CheR fusion protein